MITLRYPLELSALADACLIFIEDKTSLRLMIKTFNILAYTLLALYVVKGYQVGLSSHEGGMIALVLAWIFGRRRFNRWFIYRRLAKFSMIDRFLNVTVEDDGLHWQAGSDLKGDFTWAQIRHVIRVANGYIFPAKSGQYLWVPALAFANEPDQEAFEQFLKEKHLSFKVLSQHCGSSTPTVEPAKEGW